MGSKKVTVDIDQAARVRHDVDVDVYGGSAGAEKGDKSKVKEQVQNWTDEAGVEHTAYTARLKATDVEYIDRDGDGEAETRLTVKTKERHEVNLDEYADATVAVEGPGAQGVTVGVSQQAVVDQDTWLSLDAHGNKKHVKVKVDAVEETDIGLATQVGVTFTQERDFAVDLDQSIDLDQDSWVEMEFRRVDGMDFDVDLDQTTRVYQDADVAIRARDGNLSVSVDPDQIAVAGQEIDIDITPAEYFDG